MSNHLLRYYKAGCIPDRRPTVYVDPIKGLAEGDGTKENPYGSIRQAVASTFGHRTIKYNSDVLAASEFPLTGLNNTTIVGTWNDGL